MKNSEKNRFIILTRVKDDGQRCEHPYWNEFIISCMILNEIYCNCHAIKQTGLNDSKQTNKQTKKWRKKNQQNRTEHSRAYIQTPTEKNNAYNSFYFPQSLMQMPRKSTNKQTNEHNTNDNSQQPRAHYNQTKQNKPKHKKTHIPATSFLNGKRNYERTTEINLNWKREENNLKIANHSRSHTQCVCALQEKETN